MYRDFPEDRVFFRVGVVYRNLALLHRRVSFIVMLQNKHTTLAENGENLINTHSLGPKILISAQGD